MKVCNKCGEEKPFTSFNRHKTTKDGYGTYCKPCYNAQTRDGKYRKRYGMSSEKVDKLKEGCCTVCGSTDNLHIDHNHETGVFRGVLCSGCNRGLGYFKDNSELLLKAAEYLKERGSYTKWQS